MGRSDVCIVIPAYNEESSIVSVIQSMLVYGDVVVVDDGSTDSTVDLVRQSSAAVVQHNENRGYEAALSTGVLYAADQGYSHIITADADGELLASNIPDIIDSLKDNMLVVGKRNKKNRYLEILFGGLTSLLWGIGDPMCGMKGYSRKIILEYGDFDTRKMIGTELLAKVVRDKVRVGQVSIEVRKRDGESRYGQSFRTDIKILRTLFLFTVIASMRLGK